jgi:conjugative transfer region protein (TIGR03748 family)
MNVSYQRSRLQWVYWIVLMLSVITLSETVWAKTSPLVQTGRYLTVDSAVPVEQKDLLSPMIQIHFLSDVRTVGDAIEEVLRYSGYSLVETPQQSQDLQNTLQKPLPLIQRDLGPIPLRQSLRVLIGPAFHLIVDPLNRTINFQLNPNFQLITD